MNTPRRFGLVNSKTNMKEIEIIPEPPRPVTTLPKRKHDKDDACDVTRPPRPKRSDEAKRQVLGENIDASLAASGDVLDIAICIRQDVAEYDEHRLLTK